MMGYVYVMVNAALPGLVKIGRTQNPPDERAVDLNTTGVPDRFIVVHQAFSEDCIVHESRVHKHLEAKRYSKNREFFKISVQEAISVIDLFLESSPVHNNESLAERSPKVFSVRRVVHKFGHFSSITRFSVLNETPAEGEDVFYRRLRKFYKEFELEVYIRPMSDCILRTVCLTESLADRLVDCIALAANRLVSDFDPKTFDDRFKVSTVADSLSVAIEHTPLKITPEGQYVREHNPDFSIPFERKLDEAVLACISDMESKFLTQEARSNDASRQVHYAKVKEKYRGKV